MAKCVAELPAGTVSLQDPSRCLRIATFQHAPGWLCVCWREGGQLRLACLITCLMPELVESVCRAVVNVLQLAAATP